jgi:hypothetical protein
MKWDGKVDRRRHKRAPIRIVSEFGDPGSSIRIETADFSAGGFSCWMDHPIQPLTKLALQFEFPAFGEEPGASVGCEAVVVRCERRRDPHHGWSMAAAFVGMDPSDRRTIERYVAWHEMVMSPMEEESEGDPSTRP